MTKKSKKKRHLTASQNDNDEPDLLGAALKQTRKRKTNDQIPALYKEGLGNVGIKTKKDTSTAVATFDIDLTKEEKRRRKERQRRFMETSGSVASSEIPDGLSSALSSSRTAGKTASKSKHKSVGTRLVGTCQNLEKPYLRLTTYPKPQDVRPLEVLIKSLQHIKCRYIRDEDFSWANEQLKSVRQDITVQGLKTNFVLEVYETHARILLENGDLNEYNQCQTMICTLTTGFRADSSSNDNDEFSSQESDDDCTLLKQSETAADEFGGYRLLYALVQHSWSDLTRELARARSIIRRASDNEQSSASCRHAVLVVKAVTHNDYHAFFRLYESAPHLSAYLMDFLVRRVRTGAYERIIAAYRPTISVERFREALFLKDLEETREFLKSSGAVFVEEQGGPPFWVDCKASK